MNNDNDDGVQSETVIQYPNKSITLILVALIGLVSAAIASHINNRPDDADRFYGWQGDNLKEAIKRNKAEHTTINRKIATISKIDSETEDAVETNRFEIAILRKNAEECYERYKSVMTQLEKMHEIDDSIHNKVYVFQELQLQRNLFLQNEVNECKRNLNK